MVWEVGNIIEGVPWGKRARSERSFLAQMNALTPSPLEGRATVRLKRKLS